MIKRLVFSFLFALCMAAFAAAGQADFTDVVCFGDSLTHNDLLGVYYGNPQDLYEADPMEAAFQKGMQPGDELSSFAGAGSVSDDVESQIDLYELFRALGYQDEATMFSFEIGGNDVLDNADLLAMYPPGQNAAADAVIDTIISNLYQDLLRLKNSHPNAQFVIWTIPDITLTPKLLPDLTAGEAENMKAHIERVNRILRQARQFPFIAVLDTFSTMQWAVATPLILFGHSLVPPPAYGDYDHLFADEIHPTAVTNAIIACFIIREINRSWSETIPYYTLEELADLAHIPH